MKKNPFAYEMFKKRVDIASGRIKADLVLKNAKYINVFTEQIEEGDIAISDGYFVGIGKYEGNNEIDCKNKIISPALIDSHVHLESAMVSPRTFRDLVVPHGTCAVVADPHEITNVSGIDGFNYIMDMTEDLDLKVLMMIPSCVPSTPLDEAGAELLAKDIKPLYKNDRVYGLAEMMNSFGVVNGDKECLTKCVDCLNENKVIDGHAPSIEGHLQNAYLSACVTTDHECETYEEAIEKLSRGQWIEIREGTVCKNLKGLIGLFKAPFYQRCMLATDDNHPDTLRDLGHIDKIIRMAVSMGADPIIAVKMASINTAMHYGIDDFGAIANGYVANFIILNDLNKFEIEAVYLKGNRVSKNGEVIEKSAEKNNTLDKEKYKRVYNSFNMNEVKIDSLKINRQGKKLRALELIKGGVLTKEFICDIDTEEKMSYGVNTKNDISKIVVVERHKCTGHIGIGFIKGYGIKRGAIASSIGHDSHNIIAVGVNDEDIALAINTLKNNKGGLVIVDDKKVLGELVLEVSGIMTEKDENYVIENLEELKKISREKLSVTKDHDPFMTLAFMQLPVIPDLKIIPKGLVNVMEQKIVDAVFD